MYYTFFLLLSMVHISILSLLSPIFYIQFHVIFLFLCVDLLVLFYSKVSYIWAGDILILYGFCHLYLVWELINLVMVKYFISLSLFYSLVFSLQFEVNRSIFGNYICCMNPFNNNNNKKIDLMFYWTIWNFIVLPLTASRNHTKCVVLNELTVNLIRNFTNGFTQTHAFGWIKKTTLVCACKCVIILFFSKKRCVYGENVWVWKTYLLLCGCMDVRVQHS